MSTILKKIVVYRFNIVAVLGEKEHCYRNQNRKIKYPFPFPKATFTQGQGALVMLLI